MIKRFLATTGIAFAVAACAGAGGTSISNPFAEASGGINKPTFNEDGSVVTPVGWREWVYVGAPLTPNALNGGEAPFPEYHSVYIEPSAWEHFKETGEFAQGTQIAKELALIRDSENGNLEDGSTTEVSGRGYFMGEFAGLELAYKDSERFPDAPGGWVYYSFGHQPEPYAASAEAFPAETCNACHEENAATDYVFTQFYPVLRAREAGRTGGS
ncbi:MAG: cytochrome P460 family protein [Geminicoccaceae bacterium]